MYKLYNLQFVHVPLITLSLCVWEDFLSEDFTIFSLNYKLYDVLQVCRGRFINSRTLMVYAWVFLSMLSALKFYISYSQEPSIPFEGTPKFSNFNKIISFWIKSSLVSLIIQGFCVPKQKICANVSKTQFNKRDSRE